MKMNYANLIRRVLERWGIESGSADYEAVLGYFRGTKTSEDYDRLSPTAREVVDDVENS